MGPQKYQLSKKWPKICSTFVQLWREGS